MKRSRCTIGIMLVLIIVSIAFLLVTQQTKQNKEKETIISNGNVMPAIRISTENQAAITENENYVACDVTLSECDEQYAITSEAANIRLRGNSTLTFDKKSYRIKLEESLNILGIGEGEAKNWVLLANHCDYSLLRNYMAFQLAARLEHMQWTPSATFVELYLNEEYQGVYLLCDQLQVHNNRVNIETNSDEVDTGYFIELDKWASHNGGIEGEDYFTVNQIPYSIKSADK